MDHNMADLVIWCIFMVSIMKIVGIVLAFCVVWLGFLLVFLGFCWDFEEISLGIYKGICVLFGLIFVGFFWVSIGFVEIFLFFFWVEILILFFMDSKILVLLLC